MAHLPWIHLPSVGRFIRVRMIGQAWPGPSRKCVLLLLSRIRGGAVANRQCAVGRTVLTSIWCGHLLCNVGWNWRDHRNIFSIRVLPVLLETRVHIWTA